MPACFQMVRKSEPEKGAVKLHDIDEEICAHLGIPVDPVHWCHGWYDAIGLALACGKSFDYLLSLRLSPRLKEILKYLNDNFVSDSWYEVS